MQCTQNCDLSQASQAEQGGRPQKEEVAWQTRTVLPTTSLRPSPLTRREKALPSASMLSLDIFTHEIIALPLAYT